GRPRDRRGQPGRAPGRPRPARARAPRQSQDHSARRSAPRAGVAPAAALWALGTRRAAGRVIRVGQGFGLHPTAPGRPLVLGGVEVPAARGLAGHSDADVLTHAVADALLGALALGDLGQHFPDSDPRYRGISSLRLLALVGEQVRARGGRVVNVDATVVADSPRLAGWLEAMRARLAETLELASDRVSVKAKRAEGLGALGRQEGIAALAIALVEAPG